MRVPRCEAARVKRQPLFDMCSDHCQRAGEQFQVFWQSVPVDHRSIGAVKYGVSFLGLSEASPPVGAVIVASAVVFSLLYHRAHCPTHYYSNVGTFLRVGPNRIEPGTWNLVCTINWTN